MPQEAATAESLVQHDHNDNETEMAKKLHSTCEPFVGGGCSRACNVHTAIDTSGSKQGGLDDALRHATLVKRSYSVSLDTPFFH